MRNLAEVSKQEQLEFINSFDHVLSDLDGVIWLQYKPLTGSPECIHSLKQLGKKVHYVTNNSLVPTVLVTERLQKAGIDTEVEEVIIPILATIEYLKKINFNKELYVIGVSTIKEALKKAGFLVAPDPPQEIPETVASVVSNIGDNKNIGGVLVECDVNLTYIKLQKAVTYLRREDCIFLSGAQDPKLPIGSYGVLIGPYYFIKPIIDITGRQPYQISKPDVSYNEFIVERCKITEPNKVLFIGDSVTEDLNFATKCGYQKLLVLTGITKRDDLDKWEYPEEYKPKYYVDSLNDLYKIISDCFPTITKL